MENEKSPNSNRPPRDRKPWPMWPIAVSILSFIVFYTWFQFTFRKTEKPYEPSRAMQERIEREAEKNLYDWYNLNLTQIEEASTLDRAPLLSHKLEGPLENELPSQVVYYLPRRPILVPKLTKVFSSLSYNDQHPLEFELEMPSDFANSPSFHLIALYKESELILLAEMRVESEKDLEELNPDSPPKKLFFSIDTQPIETRQLQAKVYSAEMSYTRQLNQISTNLPAD